MPHRIAIRKAGTRRGEPHYSVECLMCPGVYGRTHIVAIGHLSKEGAQLKAAEHVATHPKGD